MLPDFDVEEVDCENVLECLYNLSELDRDILSLLSEGGEYRSSKIAEELDKDQSTAYRSLQKLSKCGLIYKEKKTIRNGGYYFVYSIRAMDKVKEEAKQCIDRWHTEMHEAVEDLEKI